MQAMGTMRAFGARAFKAASANAAKFKMNAKVFKLYAQQIPKSAQINKQHMYKFAALSAGIGSYGLYEKTKKDAHEEYHKKLTDFFNCEECLSDRVKKDFGLRLPEGEFGKECRAKIFALKKTMGLKDDVLLYFNDVPNCLANKGSGCERHGLRTIVILGAQFLKQYNARTRDFIIAHELAHIMKNHEERARIYQETCSEKEENFEMDSFLRKVASFQRKMEYEADEGAALALGHVEGALVFFGAVHDESSSHGWKLPVDTKEHDPEGTHPSPQQRCEALLALVEKYPDKFPKPFVDRINSLNP